MELTLARFEFNPNETLSALYKGHEFLCIALEDAIRKEKINGKTAIPAGRYRVDFTHSGRFNRELPILCDVPHFYGIRIHPGNTEENTEGCLLPGVDRLMVNGHWQVYRSREAMETFVLPLFKNPQENIWISILGGYSAQEMTA